MSFDLPKSRRGIVVTYSGGDATRHGGHEASTRNEIARRLAAVLGFAYAGEYEPLAEYGVRPYFVPHDTLTSETASRIGIRCETDLFGAVVPHPFAATKSITHPLVDDRSHAPAGWCAEFPRRVADVVLDGFSAFSRSDAMRAGLKCLDRGPVRVKPATGIAGLGQHRADCVTTLAEALDTIDPDAMARYGVVVEQDLVDVTTYSVGQIRVTGVVASYHGVQHVTTNHHGREVYGGSVITAVQGDFDALLALPMTDDLRIAINQARTYDQAASECLDGFIASRRNYDVAQGLDAVGRRRSGVLEQSWRAGGASGAEIGALEAFRIDPALRTVRAMTREVYADAPVVPAGATVYFAGIDPIAGPLVKYASTESDVDT